MLVTVIGGWNPEPSESHAWNIDLAPDRLAQLRQACRDLGSRLFTHGHSIVVGDDKDETADRHVVDGFLESARSSGGSADEPVVYCIERAEANGRPLFEGERDERKDQARAARFRTFDRLETDSARMAEKILSVRQADVVVTVAGLHATYTVGVAVIVAHKPIVPIGTFGGASRHLLRALRQFATGDDPVLARLEGRMWSDAVLDTALRYGGLDRRARVFFGYSSAGQGRFEPIKTFLEDNDVEVRDYQRTFRTGGSILHAVASEVRRCTHGILLFTPDDEAAGGLRRPRDNVVFEAGYTMRARGDRRTLVIVEPPARVPDDLGGLIYRRLELDRDGLSERFKRQLLAFIDDADVPAAAR